MPLYIHDCDNCKYLGAGKAKLLGNSVYDFYICEGNGRNYRSCIARFGNEGCEYMSGALFVCEELTRIDKVFLYNGLELTEEEEKRALRVLVSMFKNKLGIKDYESFSTGSDCVFGSGNIFWKDI